MIFNLTPVFHALQMKKLPMTPDTLKTFVRKMKVAARLSRDLAVPQFTTIHGYKPSQNPRKLHCKSPAVKLTITAIKRYLGLNQNAPHRKRLKSSALPQRTETPVYPLPHPDDMILLKPPLELLDIPPPSILL